MDFSGNTQFGQPQRGNALSGIIGTLIKAAPMALDVVAPEIGIPASIAIGTLANAAGNAVAGQKQSLGGDVMGGIMNAIPGGGLLRGAGKATEDTAGHVAENALANGAEKGTTDAIENPTSVNPESGQGHVNFTQDENGQTATTPNTFTPDGETTDEQMPNSYGTPKSVQPDIGTASPDVENGTPATGANATSQFIPQEGVSQQLPKSQQDIRNTAVQEMIKSQLAHGMKVDNGTQVDLANMALNAGKNDFPSFANEVNLVTGQNNGLNNAVENALRQASVGDSLNNARTTDLSGIMNPDARTNMVNEATMGTTMRGGGGSTYNDSQRALYNKVLQDQNVVLAGAGQNGYRTLQDAINSGDLIRVPGKDGGYELSPEALKNVNHLSALEASRNLNARAFGNKNTTAGEQDLYSNAANAIKSKLAENIKLTPEVKQLAINNMVENGFAKSNPTMFAALQNGIKDGSISTTSDLQKFQAPWVKAAQAYAKAPGGASKFDLLTNGKGGLVSGLLNSDTATRAKIQAARQLSKSIAKPGEQAAFNAVEPVIEQEAAASNKGGGIVGGFRKMSPLGKVLTLGGGALGVGTVLNGITTAAQAAQAQQQMNSPLDQQTNAILNNADAQQRYLGELGEIRSIFAPTFDTNAGQAGQMGAQMLAQANQNAQARQAAQNLLQARAGMGAGGILGGIASLIPGTSENAYKQEAANAQAQLNSLGVAGTAPGLMQSGNAIPSLTSMAGNVGAF